jgi:hypothetical protein
MTTFDPGPTITLEARYGFPATWVDLTCDVTGLVSKAGRTSGGPTAWQTLVSTGELRVRLNNESGRYSSFSEDGSLALGENTLLRLRCEWGGSHHALWVGYIEAWEERWTQEVDEVEIVAVDPMSLLGEQGGAFAWVPGLNFQTVQARMEQLVGRVGVAGDPFYSQPGFIHCIAPLLDNTPVIDEIHRTALSDHGVFFHEPNALPADLTATNIFPSSWVYLNRLRFDSIVAAPGAPLPSPPYPTDAADWRYVQGVIDRTYTAAVRPAQLVVPVFSDNCVEDQADVEIEYTDIEWSYIAYERPSLVTVANRAPQSERDHEGFELPLPWPEATAQIGVSDATRHKIIQMTDLRFASQAEAQQLAASVVNQLVQPKLEVSKLILWPHRDPRQFDTLLGLRMQDHVIVVRNLQHGMRGTRIEIDCLVEGVQIDLKPRPGWVEGAHHAEWKVTFILSPSLAAVEDIPELPPIDTGPGPTITYVAYPNGQRPPGATTAVPVTALIADANPAILTARLSYDTNRPQDAGTIDRVCILALNTVTLNEACLVATAIHPYEAITGGRYASAITADASSLMRGSTYSMRVVEYAVDGRTYKSNSITLSTPLPAPPKPTLVDAALWQYWTYDPGVTNTPTVISFPLLPGAIAQVGIDNQGGLDYQPYPVQSAGMFVASMPNDQMWSFAVRYATGGVVSAWSPPLILATGHPPSIAESAELLLAANYNLSCGFQQWFVAEVPLIAPPPNGPGDNQWTHDHRTFDINYARNAEGKPGGYVGTIVSKMNVRAENLNHQGFAVGDKLVIEEYNIVSAFMYHSTVPFLGFGNIIPSSWNNPTWKDQVPPNIVGVDHTMNIGVRDQDATTRNGVIGIFPYGDAYSRHPTGYDTIYRVRLRGDIELYGRTYTATPRLSNRVVG